MEEVRHIFKPEFINRVDEMIVFHALNKDHIHQITQIMIQGFVKRVKEQMDMDLTVTEEVVDFIAKKVLTRIMVPGRSAVPCRQNWKMCWQNRL